MKKIKRGDVIPDSSVRNVWVGDECICYEEGDELPPIEILVPQDSSEK